MEMGPAAGRLVPFLGLGREHVGDHLRHRNNKTGRIRSIWTRKGDRVKTDQLLLERLRFLMRCK